MMKSIQIIAFRLMNSNASHEYVAHPFGGPTLCETNHAIYP